MYFHPVTDIKPLKFLLFEFDEVKEFQQKAQTPQHENLCRVLTIWVYICSNRKLPVTNNNVWAERSLAAAMHDWNLLTDRLLKINNRAESQEIKIWRSQKDSHPNLALLWNFFSPFKKKKKQPMLNFYCYCIHETAKRHLAEPTSVSGRYCGDLLWGEAVSNRDEQSR